MNETLSPSSRRIQDALAAHGAELRVVELPASTRTAAEAAAAVGCTVAQIAKSIVFRAARSGRPILVVASGANRIDEAKVAQRIGEPIEKADADFVRARTGFAIGGVPPLGHAEPIATLVDEDLMRLGEIWAAAGTPRSVFRLTGAALLRITAGELMPVK